MKYLAQLEVRPNVTLLELGVLEYELVVRQLNVTFTRPRSTSIRTRTLHLHSNSSPSFELEARQFEYEAPSLELEFVARPIDEEGVR